MNQKETLEITERAAATEHDIHHLLRTRWSPRSFVDRPVEPEKLLSIFEAARWSPSAANKQPWAFIVATRADQDGHGKIVETLTGRNPLWAQNTPVLALAMARVDPQGSPANRYAYYDLGQAVAHLSIQATALGLQVHQMGGFDATKARELFGIPADYEPVTVIAIGDVGAPEALPEVLRQRELAARERKPLREFVFADRWGKALPLAVRSAERTDTR